MTTVREANKQRTREAISHTATRLFLDHGFDKVTIADVATAAGVAKMTVTNHFPLKEDLVLDLHEDLIHGPARVIAARPTGQSALDSLREACLAALKDRSPTLGFAGPEFVGMVTGSPALRARLREIHEQREEALARALGDDLEARFAAAQFDAVHRVVFGEVFRRTLDGQDNETVARQLVRPAGQSFERLRPAFGDYAVRA